MESLDLPFGRFFYASRSPARALCIHHPPNSMIKEDDMGHIFKRGNVYWVKYYRNGKPYRESNRK